MISDQVSSGPRRVIQATCALHPGPVGYVNLVVSKLGGEITLDAHAVGACVLTQPAQLYFRTYWHSGCGHHVV